MFVVVVFQNNCKPENTTSPVGLPPQPRSGANFVSIACMCHDLLGKQEEIVMLINGDKQVHKIHCVPSELRNTKAVLTVSPAARFFCAVYVNVP